MEKTMKVSDLVVKNGTPAAAGQRWNVLFHVSTKHVLMFTDNGGRMYEVAGFDNLDEVLKGWTVPAEQVNLMLDTLEWIEPYSYGNIKQRGKRR